MKRAHKSPKNVPIRLANLAREVYLKAYDETESFEGELGVGLAYLLGSILDNGVSAFREEDDVYVLLGKKFPPKHPVWKHVVIG